MADVICLLCGNHMTAWQKQQKALQKQGLFYT